MKVLFGSTSNEDQRTVTLEMGVNMQQELGALMHIEASAYKDLQSITYVFKRIGEELVRSNKFS